jgi:aspartate/glutamate racemase
LIGIILLDTRFQRLSGDVGNPQTFPFPVSFERVEGALPFRVVNEKDISLLSSFLQAAKVLERKGAQAITTSCGFLALWQKEIASSVTVPVFTSSLIQIPWIYEMRGRRGRIGVLTADASSLTEAHFQGVGADRVPVVVRGMKPKGEFYRVYIQNQPDIDVQKAERDVLTEILALADENSDLCAIVLECTNMPVFGKVLREAVKVPVFDIVTLACFVWSGVTKENLNPFSGWNRA